SGCRRLRASSPGARSSRRTAPITRRAGDAGSEFAEDFFHAGPRGIAGLLVRGEGIDGFLLGARLGRWRFAGAHESLTGTVVNGGLVGLAGGFHVGRRLRHRGGDARIVPAVEAVN